MQEIIPFRIHINFERYLSLISCKANCKIKVNPQERLVLEGICRNCKPWETNVTYKWELLNDAQQYAVQNGIDSYTTTGWNGRNLAFRVMSLEKDSDYTARLTVQRGTAIATASYAIGVTSPPYDGSCAAK